jgi:hypothetical protein
LSKILVARIYMSLHGGLLISQIRLLHSSLGGSYHSPKVYR